MTCRTSKWSRDLDTWHFAPPDDSDIRLHAAQGSMQQKTTKPSTNLLLEAIYYHCLWQIRYKAWIFAFLGPSSTQYLSTNDRYQLIRPISTSESSCSSDIRNDCLISRLSMCGPETYFDKQSVESVT